MKLFVPGRLCLFGEHSDWAGGYRKENPQIEKGYTLICGTNQGIYAEISPHPNKLRLTATLPDGTVKGAFELPMMAEALKREAESGGYWSYIAGTAYQVLCRHSVGGLTIHNFKTDLPVQKGLSSSAAICVLTARAFNQQYQLGLTVRQEMELAYLGETTTPSKCGRMDQGCAFGEQPMLMVFDGDQLDVEPIAVGGTFFMVVADLNAGKNTTRILADLSQHYPHPTTPVGQNLHNLLGKINKDIVKYATTALQQGDAPKLGN